jgi:holo-[acyl-carrier protein] synthase
MELNDSFYLRGHPSELSALTGVMLGTDLVYVPRVHKSFQRYGAAFLHKMLTKSEWDYCQGERVVRELHMIRRAAGRIALKEAVAKALGIGINGLGWAQGAHWKDIEVVGKSQSPPTLCLHGRALEVSTRLGIGDWRCSLSHDGDYAMATVLGLIRLSASAT